MQILAFSPFNNSDKNAFSGLVQKYYHLGSMPSRNLVHAYFRTCVEIFIFGRNIHLCDVMSFIFGRNIHLCDRNIHLCDMVVLSDVVDADGNVDDADADGADGNADADDRVMLAGLPARDQLAADTRTTGGYLWTHHRGKLSASNIDNHNMSSSNMNHHGK